MELSERGANRERWQAEVEAWRASGQTLSGWARKRGISRDALVYWKQRIPPVAAPRVPSRPPLTLIPIRPSRPEASTIAPIELVDDARPGLRIRLPAGFDAVSLARLLDLLESRC
jgi:hypothetical protein